jgi:hypothetical protein
LFDRRGLALQRNPSRRQSGIKAPVEAYHKRRAAFGDDGIDCRIGNDRGVHPDRSAVAARQALGRGRIDIDDRAEVRPEMGRNILRAIFSAGMAPSGCAEPAEADDDWAFGYYCRLTL